MGAPNDYGVYPPSQCDETLVYESSDRRTRAAILLVRVDDGWVGGIDYSSTWCGGGGWPWSGARAYPTRAAAIDAAAVRLRAAFDPALDPRSPARQAICRDVHDWIDGLAQEDLFA